MTDLTPDLAELRRLAEAATQGPWAARYGVSWEARVCATTGSLADVNSTANAELIVAAVNAIPGLLDAAAERDALAESVRAYGRTIDRWGLLIIAATHSEDITTPDGDGDWEVIESRLAEVPALLAERDALAATVERVRALHFGEYVEDEDQNRCFECGDDWPCPTIRALDEEPQP